MQAIQVENCGAPEVMNYTEVAQPIPQAGEILLKVEAIGVNFIDVYHRTGIYPLPRPFIPGMEAAGTVAALGADVTNVAVGERIAFAMHPGAYAEYVLVPAWKAVPIPATVTAEQAAAAMLQGMTAHYLVNSTYQLQAGDTALIHAAAGGVGLLLIQMAKNIGARVIGTVSTPAKAELARAAGADEIILYTEQDFAAATQQLTDGKGVQVVYDSVGKDTFMKSLDCLAPRGMLALFGQSSGVVPPFDISALAQKGSLFLTRPTLFHYAATRAELLWRAGDVFAAIQAGKLNLRIEKIFPLSDAASAHQQLEGRQTTGKILLRP